MARLKVFLLGTPYVEFDGEVLNFGRRKSLAILAYLASTMQPCSRDTLASIFWPNDHNPRARLRRTLVDLNETPLQSQIEASRDTVTLLKDDSLWVDIHEFNQLVEEQAPTKNMAAVDLYRDEFMAGFTLRNSAEFDTWQSIQTQIFQQRLTKVLEQLVSINIEAGNTTQAYDYAHRWLIVDALHERANSQFMRLCVANGQRNTALRQFEIYSELLAKELGIGPSEDMIDLYHTIKNNAPVPLIELSSESSSNLPSLPKLFIGREEILRHLKARLLDIKQEMHGQSILAVQGWPGVGKTTLASVLAHDKDLHGLFPDGVLFTSLGEQPDLFTELMNWASLVAVNGVGKTSSVKNLSERLSSALSDKHVLLIVDDVWDTNHAIPFCIGGKQSVMLITTRMNNVAQALTAKPDAIFHLPILNEEQSLELLRVIAPQVVKQNPDEAKELVNHLEGLPLALQVAGRLLHAEMQMGWGITTLLKELKEGVEILDKKAPSDLIAAGYEAAPTIRVLLQRSTNRLNIEVRKQFALLGAFAPKPATFDLNAMQAVWRVADPKPSVRTLVARGLLEPLSNGRFQMHAILVMHAKSMFGD